MALVASLSAVIERAPIRAADNVPVVIFPASSEAIFADVTAASLIIALVMYPLAIVNLSDVIDPAAIRPAAKYPEVIFEAESDPIFASVIAASAMCAVPMAASAMCAWLVARRQF